MTVYEKFMEVLDRQLQAQLITKQEYKRFKAAAEDLYIDKPIKNNWFRRLFR